MRYPHDHSRYHNNLLHSLIKEKNQHQQRVRGGAFWTPIRGPGSKPIDNFRIILLQPLLDLGVLTFGCLLHRSLRGKTPALEIIGDGAQSQADTKAPLDQIPDGFAGPECKRQFQLIRAFISDQFPDLGFLLFAQKPLLDRPTATLLSPQPLLAG